MKSNFGGFALGLFGTIPIGSEFRIFGGLTFMIIPVFCWDHSCQRYSCKDFVGQAAADVMTQKVVRRASDQAA